MAVAELGVHATQTGLPKPPHLPFLQAHAGTASGPISQLTFSTGQGKGHLLVINDGHGGS